MSGSGHHIQVSVQKMGDANRLVENQKIAAEVRQEDKTDSAKKAAEDAIRRLGETDPWLSKHPPQITWTHGMFTSWETKADDPVVKALTSASMALAGRAEVIGVTYGSEASHFANLTGASLAVFGPGNVAESHAPNQSVSIKDVMEASKILALAALTWDGAV